MLSSRLRKLTEHTRRFGFILEQSTEFLGHSSENFENIDLDSKQTLKIAHKEVFHGDHVIPPYEYGPFGSLMRKCIVDQWWKHSVTLQNRIFPISCLSLNCSEKNDALLSKGSPEFLPRTRVLKNYRSLTKTLSSKELGIGQITTLQKSNYSTTFILRSPLHEYLTVHHLCPVKKSSTIFNEQIKQRLRWWKKFSNKQARFDHEVKEHGNGTSTAEISYNGSFGKEIVETIHLGSKQEHDCIWESNASFIECCTTVEQALLTYLNDGLEERVLEEEDDGKLPDILRLHPNISPIKLIILAENPFNEEQIDLVQRLSKEVQASGISTHQLFLEKESDVYNFSDAIGTPFSLRIDERTLQRGVVALRHRDTTVHEFLHISEVKETLTKIINF